MNFAQSFAGGSGPLPALDPAVEEQRAAVCERYGIDALQDDPELAGITSFAAQLFDTPISLVSLLIGETQHFLARQGTEQTENPRSTSFCSHAMLLGSIMEVRDATRDERFAANPLVAAPPVVSAPEPPRPVEPQPEPPRVPQFEDVILPASSVIGLQLESTLTTERARIEDRVDARVTRDVLAAGRVAIPAGSRVRGSVTLVERGGKVKERARLGVRFHTLILSDGTEVPLQTEAIYREGESPAGDSAKKIGVAAVGGAILGGILGGGKGAVVGGATGAAGGTAAVMQGDRNPASLRGGEIVTARLSSPATITVARRE